MMSRVKGSTVLVGRSVDASMRSSYASVMGRPRFAEDGRVVGPPQSLQIASRVNPISSANAHETT
jgi:hypothetical protein